MHAGETMHCKPFHNVGELQLSVWGEFISPRWNSFYKGPVMLSFMFSLLSAWTTCWTNNGVTGDLRRADAPVMSVKWSRKVGGDKKGHNDNTGNIHLLYSNS